METFMNLFSTDYGLMSFAVIAFIICMGLWFFSYFKRKIDEDIKRMKIKA